MAFKILEKDLEATDENAGKMWIRPMQLGSGWAPVIMWINNEEDDIGLFPEPYNTHPLRFAGKSEAANAAYEWAEDEKIPVFMDGCIRTT